jgi:hypothetical protein
MLKRFAPMTANAYLPGSTWASLDTLPRTADVEPVAWHGVLVLGIILAASYPDFESIAN